MIELILYYLENHIKKNKTSCDNRTFRSLTTAIVKEHLSPEQPSVRQVGRKLGVHYKKVVRKLEKLAGYSD